MTSLTQLIEQLRSLADSEIGAWDAVKTTYLSPTLHIDLVTDVFEPMDLEERQAYIERLISEHFPGTEGSIQQATNRLPVTVSALTHRQAEEKHRWLSQTSASWVSAFLGEGPVASEKTSDRTTYTHFYGYKGGQGRSTLLALFAKSLADDGYRVLVVDADTEAPSLDSLFAAYADSFSQTLMGLCGWSEDFKPIAGAYAGKQGSGRIDLLPCRPRVEDADLDFALLAATAPLDSRIYERAASKLRSLVESAADAYDFVLVDHRTGIASSVLPIISALPGPTAVFARPDSNMSTVPSEMRKIVRAVFNSSSSVPGTFVSFSLDPNRKNDGPLPSSEARARETLLEELAMSIETNLLGGVTELISTEELAFNWVEWYLDRALLDSTLPEVSKLQSDNKDALVKLREVLGFPMERKEAPLPEQAPARLTGTTSVSGARDEGAFIHIPDVERLFVRGNPYAYILGRKGTGKTRLLREVANRGLGTPILVAADETSFGAIRSQSIEAEEWVRRSNGDASVFWWSLLRVAIENSGDREAAPLSNILTPKFIPAQYASPVDVKALLSHAAEQRVLLVDGLETLVPAAEIKTYIAGLFGVMNAIQNDPLLASRLVLRAFVREDLASDSVQNIEQQMEGRALRLKWSAASILNFAVSRIPLLPWISREYPEVCNDIAERSGEVRRSSLSAQDATELLLRVFPNRIRRNNLSTATFLRLYFSDAGGDDTNMATFYPRLYLSFLQKLDALAQEEINPFTTERRLNSALLNRAYDEASTEFISETKQELVHLLSLEFDSDKHRKADDQTKVTEFIAAFDGLSTPFQVDKLVSELVSRTPFSEASIRESLRRMKALRMFEERPGYAGWWRVGQLYKMGLRMKYVR